MANTSTISMIAVFTRLIIEIVERVLCFNFKHTNTDNGNMVACFHTLIEDVCGNTEYTRAINQQDSQQKYYQMTLLACFLATTPPHLWHWSDRKNHYINHGHSICPSCNSVNRNNYQHQQQQHLNNCVYNQLCLLYTSHRQYTNSTTNNTCNQQLEEGTEELEMVRKKSADINHVRQFLRHHWLQTKTEVALEMGYHASHILIAYLRYYPPTNTPSRYRHAGELVEFLLDLEEWKTPTWDDVSELITAWLQPMPHVSAQTNTTSKLQGATAASYNTVQLSPSVSGASNCKQVLIDETLTLWIRSRCKICFKNEADTVTLNCGHIFLCHNCAVKSDYCPICHEIIQTCIKSYR